VKGQSQDWGGSGESDGRRSRRSLLEMPEVTSALRVRLTGSTIMTNAVDSGFHALAFVYRQLNHLSNGFVASAVLSLALTFSPLDLYPSASLDEGRRWAFLEIGLSHKTFRKRFVERRGKGSYSCLVVLGLPSRRVASREILLGCPLDTFW
jgi:hypothetical protein